MRTAPKPAGKFTFALYVVFAILGVVVLALLGILQHHRARRATVSIATGTDGGTYSVLGTQLAHVLEQYGMSGQHFTPLRTQGDLENLDMLVKRETDIGFVTEHVLLDFVHNHPEKANDVSVVAKLYPTVVQLVVAEPFSDITDLSQFQRKYRDTVEHAKAGEPLQLFVGGPLSGNRILATQLLAAFALVEGEDYVVAEDVEQFADAAALLLDQGRKLDAAFFASGAPTDAVDFACRNKCRLIDVVSTAAVGFGTPLRIPARTYEGQDKSIRAVADDVYLMCHSDSESDVIKDIENALVDNLNDLLLAHTTAHDIRLNSMFAAPPGLSLHPATLAFRESEAKRLAIVTGTCGGTYYNIGKGIQSLLRERGIRSTVIQTDGSLENVRLLKERRPTLAILQHDVAVASLWGQPKLVYKGEPQAKLGQTEWTVPAVDDIRRIATLHDEVLFIFARTDADPPIETLGDLDETNANVCVGPKGSGTQLVAQAVLSQSRGKDGFSPIQLAHPVELSVRDMVTQLLHGDLDVGFAASGADSDLLGPLFGNEKIELLGVPESALSRLHSAAIGIDARVRANQHGRPRVSEQRVTPAIPSLGPGAAGPTQTTAALQDVPAVKTKALLVCNNAVSNVYGITKAVFDGAGLIEIDQETLKSPVASVPLHDEAGRYYKDQGFLPKDDRVDVLTVLGTLSGIVVSLMTLGSSLVLAFGSRCRTNRLAREILTVDVEDKPVEAIARLREIQERVRIQARTGVWKLRIRFWTEGALGPEQWRTLNELIERRKSVATEAIVARLLSDICELDRFATSGDPAVENRRDELWGMVEWYVEHRVIGQSQYEMLARLLTERARRGRQSSQADILGTAIQKVDIAPGKPVTQSTGVSEKTTETEVEATCPPEAELLAM